MADPVTALDRDVTALEARFEQWDVACRSHVADECAANEMQRVVAENSRGGIPLATAEALATYEDTWRRQYDTQQAVAGTMLEAETNALQAANAEAIQAAETLKSERDLARGTGEHFQAGTLEELIGQRLRAEWSAMTLTELDASHEAMTDDGDRTASRMIEAAVMSRGGLSRLRLQADDPERDTRAIQALQRRVAERRRARVPAALYAQQTRLEQIWNLPRTHLRMHLAEGRGIARRPRPQTVRVGGVA